MRKFLFVFVVVLIAAGMPSKVYAFSCSVLHELRPYQGSSTVVRARLAEDAVGLEFDVKEVYYGEAGEKITLKRQSFGPFSTQPPYAVKGKDYIIHVPKDGAIGACTFPFVYDIGQMEVVSFVIHSRLRKVSEMVSSQELYKKQEQAIDLFSKELEKTEAPASFQKIKRYIYFYKIAVQIAHGDFDAAQATWDEMSGKTGVPDRRYESWPDDIPRSIIRNSPDDRIAWELQGRIYLGRGDIQAANDFFAEQTKRDYFFSAWNVRTLHDLGRAQDLPQEDAYKSYREKGAEEALDWAKRIISENSKVEKFYPVPILPQ